MTSPRTLLGPLTTTWTQPAVCSYPMALGCATCNTGYQGQTCNVASNAHDWTDCWPPRATSMADPGVMMGWGLYSPGIVCPLGYTTAAMATAGGSTGWGLEYSLTQGETAAACCPSGFTPSTIDVSNTYAATCVVVATSSSFSTVVCDSGTFTAFSLITIPNSGMQSFTVYAPLFQLNFQATDLPAAVITSAAGQSTSATSASPASGQTGASSTTTSDPVASLIPSSLRSTSSSAAATGGAGGSSSSDGGGLPTGAKIGIGVGAAVVALILLAFAFFILRSRRKTKAAGAAEVAAADDEKAAGAGGADRKDGAGGVGAVPKRKKSERAELGGDDVMELDGHRVEAGKPAPQELGATGLSIGEPRQPVAIFELEADTSTLHLPPRSVGRPSMDDPHSLVSPATPTRSDHGHVVSPTTPTRPGHHDDT